ncbi:unnamed protein product, partial [Phaeothamnion confervicola]
DRALERLERREALVEKVKEITELKVRGSYCRTCRVTRDRGSVACHDRGHIQNDVTATRRFFECRKCRARCTTLDARLPATCCGRCGANEWAASS